MTCFYKIWFVSWSDVTYGYCDNDLINFIFGCVRPHKDVSCSLSFKNIKTKLCNWMDINIFVNYIATDGYWFFYFGVYMECYMNSTEMIILSDCTLKIIAIYIWN